MVELSQRHLCPNVLAHRHHRNAEHGERLEGIVRLLPILLSVLVLVIFLLLFLLLLLRVDVLVTVVEHRLDLQHVARARERADVDQNLRLL